MPRAREVRIADAFDAIDALLAAILLEAALFLEATFTFDAFATLRTVVGRRDDDFFTAAPEIFGARFIEFLALDVFTVFPATCFVFAVDAACAPLVSKSTVGSASAPMSAEAAMARRSSGR